MLGRPLIVQATTISAFRFNFKSREGIGFELLTLFFHTPDQSEPIEFAIKRPYY